MIELLLVTALSAFQPSSPHPDSLSTSTLRVGESEATWEHVIQVASLAEAFPGLDANFDGELDRSELAANETLLASYFNEHWRAFVDEEAASWQLVSLEPGREPGYVSAKRRSVLADRFELAIDPFTEKDPWHRSLVQVHFSSEKSVPFAFGASVVRREVARIAIRRRATLLDFLRYGARHAFSRTQIAFLLAMFLALAANRRAPAMFLLAAAAAAIPLWAGLEFPQPFTALFVAGGVALAGVECFFASKAPLRIWLVPVLGSLATLSLAEHLASFPIDIRVQESALIGLVLGWALTTTALAVALAQLFGRLAGGRSLALGAALAGALAFARAAGFQG